MHRNNSNREDALKHVQLQRGKLRAGQNSRFDIHR